MKESYEKASPAYNVSTYLKEQARNGNRVLYLASRESGYEERLKELAREDGVDALVFLR